MPRALQRHNTASALHLAVPVVQRLEGMVTSLSPKILNASFQMSAKAGFHTDLHFQSQGSLLNSASDSLRGKPVEGNSSKGVVRMEMDIKRTGQGVNLALPGKQCYQSK